MTLLVAATLLGALGQDGAGQRKGGPPPVFRVEVPESRLDVIAGAPTDKSIVLSIRGASESKIELTLQDDRPRSISVPKVAAGKPVEVPISGLKAGRVYRYVAKQGDEKVEGQFTTARPRGGGFKFVVQADSHLDANSDLRVYERTLGNMVADAPDFLVDLGDTFMVDKYKEYKDSLRQYVAQRYWFSKVGSQMSVFLCLGNHDGETGWPSRGGEGITAWSQEQRETYFPVIRGGSFYTGAAKKGLYYAWDWGDATFVVLDPFMATTRKSRNDEDGWNWTLGREQFDWFERTLKASRSKFKFVFIHHLVGGFGGEARGGVEAADRFEWGGKEQFPQKRTGWAEPIHSLMVKYGVSAMFHGHDHLYVRQEKDGIVYMEVPQPSMARENATSSAEKYGYKTGKLLGSSGHIRVTVAGERAKIEYVKSLASSENGKVVDSVEVGAKR